MPLRPETLRRQHEELVASFKKRFPDVKVLAQVDAQHIRLQCKCGKIWECRKYSASQRSVLMCHQCALQRMAENKRVDRDEFLRRLQKKHGNLYQLVGNHRPGMGFIGRFRCNNCHTSFKRTLSQVLALKRPCQRCESAARGEVMRRVGRRSSYKLKEVEIGGKMFTVQGYEPQAIEWLLWREPRLRADDIATDHEGTVPTFRYRIGRRTRTYFPDIYIKRCNLIVEVKSRYTLGLETGREWRKNQAKAKAVIEAGYSFLLLQMGPDGKRLVKMPEDWYKKSREKVLLEIACANADIVSPKTKIKSFKPSGPKRSK